MILRALLIEDNENDAILTIHLLEKSSYQVKGEIIQTEAEMKKSLARQEWDVIIADYQLPNFSAPAALSLLQETELDIPFIVVSGAIGEETAVDLMKAGACDYLIKDKLARLAPAVKRELNEAQVRRQRRAANQALIESERNLQESQSIAHIGHWIKNFPGGDAIWSDEIYRIFGLPAGDPDVDLKVAWDKAFSVTENPAKDIYRLRPGEQAEYRILRPDGSGRFVLATAGETLLDKEGNILQVSGVLQDITDRKAIELELLEKISESQRRAHELEIVSSVSSRLRQAQSRHEMVGIVLSELAALMNARFLTLGAIERNALVFEDAIGNRTPWERRQVSLKNDLFEDVALMRKPLILVHSLNHDRLALLPKWFTEELNPAGLSILCPLLNGENLIGMITLSCDQAFSISIEKIGLVTALTDIIGNAVNRQLASEKLESMVERREKELEYIFKITSAASNSAQIRLALQEALALTLAAVGAENGGIYLFDEENSTPEWVIFHGMDEQQMETFKQIFNGGVIEKIIDEKRPLLFPTRETDSMRGRVHIINSAAGLPMLIQGRANGMLAIRKAQDEQINVEELTLLSFIADHLALVVENTRLIKKAEKSAIIEERSRMARELHDSVTQLLYSAKLFSEGAQKYLALRNYKEVEGYLAQISDLTQQALKDLRLMVYELRSRELANSGLQGALQHRLEAVEKRFGIKVSFQSEYIPRLSETMEENFFRIAMEALNNSLKHSQATALKVELSQVDQSLRLAIEDDGVGFEMRAIAGQGGIGLATMRERTEKMGGQFQILSRPGEGTRVEISAPFMINSSLERGNP